MICCFELESRYQTAAFCIKVSCSGLIITKQVAASESEVLHARYSNKYACAPKLEMSAGIGLKTTLGYRIISPGY